jgi:hypothetical protein
MVTMVMVTTLTALLTVGGNDSNYVGNLPVSGDANGERKKKVKTGQQSKGGGEDNEELDVPNHNET